MGLEPAPTQEDMFISKGVMAASWKKWFGILFDLLRITPTPYTGPTTQVSAAPYPGAITTRALNTVYQNTTGKPMWIRIRGTASSSAGNLFLYTDAANPPTELIDKTVMYVTTNDDSVGAIVMPGNNYKVTYDGGVTITKWTEWY